MTGLPAVPSLLDLHAAIRSVAESITSSPEDLDPPLMILGEKATAAARYWNYQHDSGRYTVELETVQAWTALVNMIDEFFGNLMEPVEDHTQHVLKVLRSLKAMQDQARAMLLAGMV